MPVGKANMLTFDVSIEQIIRDEAPFDARLPEKQSLLPSEQGPQSQLDALVQAATLDDAIKKFLQPHIEHKDILLPHRYRDLVDHAHDSFSQLASETADGDDKEFAAAKEVLEHQKELLDLLQLHRSLLFQA